MLIGAFVICLIVPSVELAAGAGASNSRGIIESGIVHSEMSTGQRICLNFLKPPIERSVSMPSILQTRKKLWRSRSSADIIYRPLTSRAANFKAIAWKSPSASNAGKSQSTSDAERRDSFPANSMQLFVNKPRHSIPLRAHASTSIEERQDSSDFFRPDDANDIWLEDVDSQESLKWVAARNAETLGSCKFAFHIGNSRLHAL